MEIDADANQATMAVRPSTSNGEVVGVKLKSAKEQQALSPNTAAEEVNRLIDCGGDCMSQWDFAENAAWNEAFGRSRDGR
jgi:hypothetical protein